MFEKNNNTDEFSCIDSTVAEVNPLTHPHQPIKVYDNAKTFKEEILKDFKGKTIIYLWYNKITGKVYVGSAACGAKRLTCYYQASVLKNCSLIYKSILKFSPL